MRPAALLAKTFAAGNDRGGFVPLHPRPARRFRRADACQQEEKV